MRDLAPQDPNWIHDAIEWIGEALEHIGASAQLVKKTCIIDINNHKNSLPNDLYYIEQVALNKSAEKLSLENKIDDLNAEIAALAKTYSDAKNTFADQFQGYDEDIKAYTPDLTEVVNTYTNSLPGYGNLIKTTDSTVRRTLQQAQVVYEQYANVDPTKMQTLEVCTSSFGVADDCPECNDTSTVCYYTEADMIKTSFEKGKICVAYKAFPTDHDCYPLVPDSISFKEALFWYIFKKLLLRGMQSPNGFNYMSANQQWQYYCTQARNEAVFPDIPQMESFMNQWVRLLPNINRSEEQFENLGNREDIYRGRFNTYGTR
jgi:hypothetical protein